MLETVTPTKRAAAFMAANAVSPIIEGNTTSNGGIKLTLEDGQTFKLSDKDQKSFEAPLRWLHG